MFLFVNIKNIKNLYEDIFLLLAKEILVGVDFTVGKGDVDTKY